MPNGILNAASVAHNGTVGTTLVVTFLSFSLSLRVSNWLLSMCIHVDVGLATFFISFSCIKRGSACNEHSCFVAILL